MSALEKAKLAWASHNEGVSQAQIDERLRVFTTLLRALADEGVLTAARFADLMGVSLAKAKELFQGLAALGMQFDESGNIVGAALTTLESPHRIQVRGKALFAWCALDTLFIPGLLGTTGEIESTCPKSGETLRLVVTPERIEESEPSDIWLSVFLPGYGSANPLGPATPT